MISEKILAALTLILCAMALVMILPWLLFITFALAAVGMGIAAAIWFWTY